MKTTILLSTISLTLLTLLGCQKEHPFPEQDIPPEEFKAKSGPDCDNDLVFVGDAWASGHSNAPSTYADDAMAILNDHYAITDKNCRVQFNSNPIVETIYHPVSTNCESALNLNDDIGNLWDYASQTAAPTITYSNGLGTFTKPYTPTHFEFVDIAWLQGVEGPHFEIEVKYELIICKVAAVK